MGNNLLRNIATQEIVDIVNGAIYFEIDEEFLKYKDELLDNIIDEFCDHIKINEIIHDNKKLYGIIIQLKNNYYNIFNVNKSNKDVLKILGENFTYAENILEDYPTIRYGFYIVCHDEKFENDYDKRKIVKIKNNFSNEICW